METKVILNGIDFSEIVGEPMYLGDSCYIPIDFLKAFFKAQIQIDQANKLIKIDINPNDLLSGLSVKNPSGKINLGANVTKDEKGNVKARAGLTIRELFKASIDQNGKVEAGVNIKLF